jgi:hypothetical protein
VRKLAPSDGWQTTAVAVARRVVEDEQEDAVVVALFVSVPRYCGKGVLLTARDP